MTEPMNATGLAPLALAAFSGICAWLTSKGILGENSLDDYFFSMMMKLLFVGELFFYAVFIWAALSFNIWPLQSPYR